MANRIFAIDLGAYSIKVAVASSGLRGATIGDVVERLVPPGAEPYEQRALPVLASLLRELAFDHDNAYLGVSGDQVFTHVLEFGFSSLRRADLEKAVGAELEGIVPLDLEEMVFAFEPIPAEPVAKPLAAAAGDDEPTVATGQPPKPPTAPSGMRVLSYAMSIERARALLRFGTSAGAEPRSLLPIGGAFARLADKVPALARLRAQGPVAVIDVGHERTDVVVVRNGKPVYSRTVPRGGRHVTAAVAHHWQMDWPAAEQAKHSDGFIGSTAEPPVSDAWRRIHDVVVTELGPWARDLRQTMAACRTRTGAQAVGVLLVGGGSRLRGIHAFLAEQLGVPVWPVAAADAAAIALPKLERSFDTAFFALGMALDAGSGRPLFDLRRGPLAFKVDLSFVRAKALHLATAGLVIVAFGAASAWAGHYKLRKAEKVLVERLASESTEHYGSVKSADEILDSAGPTGAAAESPLPKKTAYDLLVDVSAAMPANTAVTLDVAQLDIEAGKVFIRGSAKTPEEIDAIVTSLKAVECLGEASRGATQSGSAGEKLFSLTFKPSCM